MPPVSLSLFLFSIYSACQSLHLITACARSTNSDSLFRICLSYDCSLSLFSSCSRDFLFSMLHSLFSFASSRCPHIPMANSPASLSLSLSVSTTTLLTKKGRKELHRVMDSLTWHCILPTVCLSHTLQIDGVSIFTRFFPSILVFFSFFLSRTPLYSTDALVC